MKGEVARYRGFHGGECGRCGGNNTAYEIYGSSGIEGICLNCSRPVALSPADKRKYMERYRGRSN